MIATSAKIYFTAFHIMHKYMYYVLNNTNIPIPYFKFFTIVVTLHKVILWYKIQKTKSKKWKIKKNNICIIKLLSANLWIDFYIFCTGCSRIHKGAWNCKTYTMNKNIFFFSLLWELVYVINRSLKLANYVPFSNRVQLNSTTNEKLLSNT